jgi:predicted nucleotidyltransferase
MIDVLQTTLADAVQWLEAEGISYALIGGIAVSLRGQPRTTADVDLVIAANVPRVLQLLGQLSRSPFRPLFDDVEEVVQRALILPLRHAKTGIKVDVAIGLSGFERQAIERAESITVGGGVVCVATAEDLILMKLLAGRPQDMEDVRGIVAARQQNLDWDYCLGVAAELQEAVEQDLVKRVHELRDDL